jgi:hypothetical protein
MSKHLFSKMLVEINIQASPGGNRVTEYCLPSSELSLRTPEGQ